MNYKVFVQPIHENIKSDIQLDEETGTEQIFIEGVGLQANIKNKNGRTYPDAVLDEAINQHVKDFFSLGRCCGELKHPKTNAHELDENRISHRFTQIDREDQNNWRLKALLLPTTTGTQLKNLINGGITMGFSSRCLGQMKNNVVQSGLKIVSLSDVVLNNSAPDALVSAIYENKEWVYENGVLIEKDLSEEIDTYKKMISKTTKNDRSKIFEKIILDYFKTIEVN